MLFGAGQEPYGGFLEFFPLKKPSAMVKNEHYKSEVEEDGWMEIGDCKTKTFYPLKYQNSCGWL